MIKTAIIGLGKMGQIRLQTLLKHPEFEVVALCDIDKNCWKSEAIPCYNHIDDLIPMKLDAIFICTFNNQTAFTCNKFLKAGCHVFAEKPPGINYKQTQSIVQCWKESTTKESKSTIKKRPVLKFGFNHRFHPSVMMAKEMVENQSLGKIQWAKGIYGKAQEEKDVCNWRSKPELAGGGILLDQGIHLLDLLGYFLGDFLEIKGFHQGQKSNMNYPMDTDTFALLKTKEGRIATLHSSTNLRKYTFHLELGFQKGHLILEGLQTSTGNYAPVTLSVFPKNEIFTFETQNSWELELYDFYQAIINGADHLKAGSPQEALNLMRNLEWIYE